MKAGEGDTRGNPAGVRDRFMIDGHQTGDRFALVQHLFAPRALAAPMHRHHLEDEYTFVMSGRIGAVLGDEEVFGEPGDLFFNLAVSGTPSGTLATNPLLCSSSFRPPAWNSSFVPSGQ